MPCVFILWGRWEIFHFDIRASWNETQKRNENRKEKAKKIRRILNLTVVRADDTPFRPLNRVSIYSQLSRSMSGLGVKIDYQVDASKVNMTCRKSRVKGVTDIPALQLPAVFQAWQSDD